MNKKTTTKLILNSIYGIRAKLSNDINSNAKNFVYCDTDSVKIPDEWITTNALADILKISRSCANKWLERDISALYKIAKNCGFVLRGKFKINNKKTGVIIRWNIKKR